MNHELQKVEFHGQELFLVEHNGEPFTPMKPIVEGMGMDWSTQQRKFTQNSKRWGVVNMTIVAQDGRQRDMVCMPVRKLPAYTSSVNPKKVHPEIQATIEMYQDECDEALWSYWNEGHVTNPRIMNQSEFLALPDITKAAVNLAETLGLTGNQALLSADRAVQRITGTSPLALMDMTHLPKEKQVLNLTPTQMGKELDLSGRKVNQLLADMGFQERQDKDWVVTEAGQSYAVLLDTGRQHSTGVAITQTKWTADVVELLRQKRDLAVI